MAVRNLDKVKAKIAKIPANMRGAVAQATDKNADQMVGLAKRLAPIRSGALVASIHKEDGDTELGKRVVAGGLKAFYARFVEFGTRGGVAGETVTSKVKKTFGGAAKQARTRKVKRTHPGTRAQPFFFPAYRALKQTMKGRVSRAAKAALKS